jgi:MoxR-like ATPase
LDESKRQSTAYNALKRGPELVLPREIIPREDIVNSILTAITPTEERRGYSIVVGDHGTGKSTSVALALERLGEPKGVAYVRIPISPGRGSKINFANAMRRALGLEPNLVDKPGN